MNGKIKDEIEQEIQKIMEKYCSDDVRWPDGHCPDQLARRMADAAEVVFDTSFESSVYTRECNT